MPDKPRVAQKSVQELIDKELDEGRGIHDIVYRFRNCVIVRALERCQNNQVHAAELIKTHRNTVSKWVRFHGLQGGL